MYTEDDLLPVSALRHLAYCPRSCALMYVEQLWDENRFTALGKQVHERVHQQESETRAGVRIVRGLRLHSLKLGLSGMADVVEFHRLGATHGVRGVGPVLGEENNDAIGCKLEGLPGLWQPFPVEHKRGHEKPDLSDEVQLCAQGLCLEEMLGVPIAEGAIFYHQPRRRHAVVFTTELRQETERLALQLHEMVAASVTPPGEFGRKCRNCSLVDICVPKITGQRRSARRYLAATLATLAEEGGE